MERGTLSENQLVESIEKLALSQPALLAIGPDTRLEDVLQAVAEAANDVMGGDFCVVYPYDRSSDDFLMDQLTVAGTDEARNFTWTKPREKGIVREALQKGTFISENYAQDMERFPFLASGPGAFKEVGGTQAAIGIRLRAGDENVGVLFISYSEPQSFTKEKRQITELFANQAALAIRNVRLYENQTRALTRLKGLLTASQSVTILHKDIDPREALVETVNAAKDVLEADVAVIFSYDQKSDRFRMDQLVVAGKGTKGYTWQTPRENGATRQILVREELLAVNLDEAPKEWQSVLASGAFEQHFEIKSVVGVPLRVGDERVGVLYLNYKSPRLFSEEDRELIQAFANLAAAILRNVRLFDELSRTSERLKAIVDVSQAISTIGEEVKPEEVLKTIPEAANDVLGADLSLIFVYDEQADRFIMEQLVHAGKGADDFTWKEPREDGATRRLLNEKTMVAVNVGEAPEKWSTLLGTGTFKEHFEVQAVAGIPLRVGAARVGVMYVNYQTTHTFDQQERDLIQAFANEAAIAIHNTRLYTESQRRVRELALLIDVQREMLGRAFDLNRVIESILANGLNLIEASIGQLLLIEGDDLMIRASTGTDAGTRVPIDDCVSGIAVQEERVVNVQDVQKEEPYCEKYKWFLGKELGQEMRSELVVPLFVEDDVIGVLNIESPEVGAFTEHDENILTALAGQAATAITIAQRYEEQEALRRIQETILSATFDLGATEELIRDNMLKLLDATHGQLALLEGDFLVIRCSTGKDTGTRVHIDGCISGLAVKEKKPIRVPNVQKGPYKDLYQWFLGVEEGKRMRSELVAPILSEGKVIGVLNVESPQEEAFTKSDEALLMTLAGLAATAIRAAEAGEEKRLAAVGALSGDIVHRLNNPMGVIRQRIELLSKKRADLLAQDEYLAKFLTVVDRNVEKVMGMVRELRERDREPTQAMAIWPFLTAALTRAEISDSIKVAADADDHLPRALANSRLENVFYNLITNAVEAMPKGGKLKITTEVEDGEWIKVVFQDTGRGIPNYMLEDIFRPSFSTKEEGEHGLGLWWSRAVVEGYGGTLTAQSEVGKGSHFVVRLRRAM